MIKFSDEGHKYSSTDGANINWTSVTTAVHHFTQPFDEKAISKLVSTKRSSKWYGMTIPAILNQWKATNSYSLKVGNWYHNMMETAALSHESIMVDGFNLKIVKPIVVGTEKFAPVQKLENNCKYPEHFAYLKSSALCGQSDDVETVNGLLNIGDFKTNKEIKLQSFKHWETGHQMMKPPFQHLQDCNFNHYSLQLSIYMYMILKHNPQLKPGKITLKHIFFEESGRDKFDNPIYKEDEHGNFFVKDTHEYKIPYLKTECQVLVQWLKTYKIPPKSE